MIVKPTSEFARRLDMLIERWAKALPPDMGPSFSDDLRRLGTDHDDALELIERAWTRRERVYAFDETGLARRRPFFDHLAGLLSVLDSSSAVGVLFVDVDKLKDINDRFGHAVGDQAVQTVGALLQESLRIDRNSGDVLTRAADERDDYSVSHYGGDEFVAVLELKASDDMISVAKRISARVNDPVAQRHRGFSSSVTLTASVGAVVCELSGPLPHAGPLLARSLVEAADQQMYACKRAGRVHVAFAAVTDARTLQCKQMRTVVL